ncbi:MAG: cupin domain-containing protein, partial [Myxococcota bacterium]
VALNRTYSLTAPLLPLLATYACTAADAAPKNDVAYVVSGKDAPAYLIAGGYGIAKLYVNASTGARDVAVSILTLAPGATIPEHVHDTSSETLYIERGEVEIIIAGKKLTARQGDTVYIPSGVRHSAKVIGPIDTLKAIQVYVGPGPEQRFAKGKPIAKR